MSLNVHVINCTVAPSSAPTEIGQHWVDTTTGDMYFSIGTTDVTDWVLLEKVYPFGSPAVVQARRTTVQAITTSFADISFDVTDIELLDTKLEHDDVDRDRIQIKEDGTYLISYTSSTNVQNASTSKDPAWEQHVRKNDTTVLDGSLTSSGDHYSGSAGVWEGEVLTNQFYAELVDGDYISTQIRNIQDPGAATEEVSIGAILTIMKVDNIEGPVGPQGPTGAGANIVVQKDDSTVGTVTATLNFEGAGVTSAVDDGGNKTTVTIGGGVFGAEYQFAESTGLSTTTNTTYTQKMRLTTTSLPAGDYHIQWMAEYGSDNTDREMHIRIEEDDTTELAESSGAHKIDNETFVSFSGFTKRTLTAGVHTYDIDFKRTDNTAQVRNARIVLWRIS